MESLGTQTGILPIRRILAWIALLQVVVLQVGIIGAENLDPVQFTFSANFPKNKSLNPLPKHFDKFGDSENDCCPLVLFFEVKDLDMEGTNEDPPKMEGAQAQTGTGEATFKFEHPDIRDTDKSFTMDVAMDQDLVKSRHILNFDTCSSIIQKTYNIFATTSITDVKDVKVIVVNGKDVNIKCKDSTAIRPTPMNSSSFCTDPEDYECKHLGITKCVPKLDRSTTQKPLPIEKPPCHVSTPTHGARSAAPASTRTSTATAGPTRSTAPARTPTAARAGRESSSQTYSTSVGMENVGRIV